LRRGIPFWHSRRVLPGELESIFPEFGLDSGDCGRHNGAAPPARLPRVCPLSSTTIEPSILSRLFLAFAVVVAVGSRAEAQQQVYYQTEAAPGVVAAPAAPTFVFPTTLYQAAQAVMAPQTYQPVAGQVQYVQPAAGQVQYVQQPAAPAVQYVQQPAAEPVQYAQQPAAEPVQYAQQQPAAEAAAAPAPAQAQSWGDPYGFTAWLNGIRASYGLGPVSHDPNLSNWAAMNNDQQAARGLGHFVMGPARFQNSGMGGFPGVEAMWMASPAHRAALLDPTISFIGIAGAGAWWTFNAN